MPDERPKRGRGRRRLALDDRKMTVSVALPTRLVDELARTAVRHRVSIGEVVRRRLNPTRERSPQGAVAKENVSARILPSEVSNMKTTVGRGAAVGLLVLLAACDTSGPTYPTGTTPPTSPSIPTSPNFRPPDASNPNELVGSVYRVESDRVFHVYGQRVEIPPDVAVSGMIVEGSYVRVRGSSSGAVFYATEIIVLGDGPAYQLDGQIEAIDTGSGTVHLLGLELLVNEWAQRLGIGQWVSVRAHPNRFVQSLSGQYGTFVGHSAVEGGWFKDVLPPTRFTLPSVVDFTVLVSTTTDFRLTYRAWDGDCYGADPVSGDEFWKRAGEFRPVGSASVSAVGRFEGGILIAHQVWLCYP